MSRRRRRSERATSNSNFGRDVFKPTPIAKRKRLPQRMRQNLRVLSDRRFYHPDPLTPLYAEPRSSLRLTVRSPHVVVGSPNTNVSRKDTVRHSFRGSVPMSVGFEVPENVVHCVRRKRRREVLHALGIAGGRGLGRNRRQHRNEFSEVGC